MNLFILFYYPSPNHHSIPSINPDTLNPPHQSTPSSHQSYSPYTTPSNIIPPQPHQKSMKNDSILTHYPLKNIFFVVAIHKGEEITDLNQF